MTSLSIAAVALLGTALSSGNAQQVKSSHPAPDRGQHLTLTAARGPSQISSLLGTTPKAHGAAQSMSPLLGTTNPNSHHSKQLPVKTGPTNGPSHHSFVSGGSDNCGTATAISGSGPFTGDNAGANTDGPSNCGALAADVWYDWTAGSTGTAVFSLCGSAYDTAISVYDTSACTGALLACNDDTCGLQSQVAVAVTGGNVYKVQVGGFAGSTGSYTLSINNGGVSGGSDTCGTATPISGPGPFNGSNQGANTDGPSNCGALAADVWYDWTAGFTGPAVVAMCGSGYDTAISVYDTAACTGTLLGCNDDSCGLQSQLNVPVVNGNVYKIQVGGFAGNMGTYTMTITAAPTCPCSGAPPEGEPGCGVPTDTFNGGCNSNPPVYSSISCGGSVCGNGAFNGSYRDTDWYQFTVTAPTIVTWTVTGEYGVNAGILDNNCPPNILAFVGGAACQPTVATANVGTGTYVVFAAPDFSQIINCGTNDSYLGQLSCSAAPTCPCSGAPPEGEPGCGVPTDTFNGGCNSNPPVYSAISCGGTVCGNGAFNGSYRDTDWYQFTVTGSTQVTWTLTGEYGIVAGILDNNCPPNLLSFVQGPACTAVVATATVSAGTYVAFAAPDFSQIITCGTNDSYLGALTCVPVAPPGPCDVLHDGSSENAVGFGAPTGTDIMWLQRQSDVANTSTVVSSISTAWGTAAFPGNGPAVGSTQRIGIWQDTDNDGNPTTGLSLVAGFPMNVTVTNVDNDVLDTYQLSPPVVIAGTYFIGASSEGAFPSPLDQSVAGSGRSWIVGNPNGAATINYANLNGEPIPPLSEDNIAPGVWLIQADCDAKGTIEDFCRPGIDNVPPCPCGPGGPGRGCANSDHTGGALLQSTGGASINVDTLVFSSARDPGTGQNGYHASSLAILFQGGVLINGVTYGGGVRCFGGPIKRLYQFHPASGLLLTAPSATSFPPNVPVHTRSAQLGDTLAAGTIRGYQLAYRDPASCNGPPNTFNVTQGIRVVWAP